MRGRRDPADDSEVLTPEDGTLQIDVDFRDRFRSGRAAAEKQFDGKSIALLVSSFSASSLMAPRSQWRS